MYYNIFNEVKDIEFLTTLNYLYGKSFKKPYIIWNNIINIYIKIYYIEFKMVWQFKWIIVLLTFFDCMIKQYIQIKDFIISQVKYFIPILAWDLKDLVSIPMLESRVI